MTVSTPRVPPSGLATGQLVKDSALGWVPETLEPLMALQARLWRDGPLGPALLELLRLRNAQAVNCVMCKSVRYDVARHDGLDETKIAAMGSDRNSPLLSDREKLALAFADAYLIDPDGLDESLRQRLIQTFTPAELGHMALALASFNALSKCAVSLGGMPDSLPIMELSLVAAIGS